MNKISRNMLLGAILGDGHLSKNGDGRILHSAAQKDYLEWKLRVLKMCGINCSEICYKNNNGKDILGFYSYGSPRVTIGVVLSKDVK